jgi:hypothetical protein
MDFKTKKGVLKCRMPNILEAYDLLEASGVNDEVKPSNLKLKRNIIMAMAPLIDFSEIEGATSYDDLLSDIENMAMPLSEVADSVIEKAFGAFKKKK